VNEEVASVNESSATTFSLQEDEVHQIDHLARELCSAADGTIDDPRWLAAARHAWHEAPVRLRRAVREFRRDPGPGGVLLLRGLPVDAANLPDTPTENDSVERRAAVPAAVAMLVTHGLGDPVAFRPEKTGALVQNVVPVPGKEEMQGNSGSVRLTFHTENAFHPHRPDFVLLMCLRPDHERIAELGTACARQVVPKLSEPARAALSAPEFVTTAPLSFGLAGASAEPHAVLPGDPEDPGLRVDEASTEPLTERGAEALRELSEMFDSCRDPVLLRTGDLAVVDNRVTVHGRSAFTPRYDGRDRWLHRTFALTDLRRSRDHRVHDGHVLD